MSKQSTALQIISNLKFTAYFERPLDYNGEFGFDWMRSDYKTICQDYEALKKEYTPIKVHGQDYFVPWLSMFPEQKNVTLKLRAESIDDTKTGSDLSGKETIKLPSVKGIRFEPDHLVLKEQQGKEVLITISCDTPLTEDVFIEFKDQNDSTVGALNVFANANHKDLHFEITPVRILRSASPQSDRDTIENMIDHSQGFGDKNKDLNSDLQDLETYLNTQALNQALLQCNIGKVYDIVIDENEWIADDLIMEDSCVFKGNLLDKFSQEFKNNTLNKLKKEV